MLMWCDATKRDDRILPSLPFHARTTTTTSPAGMQPAENYHKMGSLWISIRNYHRIYETRASSGQRLIWCKLSCKLIHLTWLNTQTPSIATWIQGRQIQTHNIMFALILRRQITAFSSCRIFLIQRIQWTQKKCIFSPFFFSCSMVAARWHTSGICWFGKRHNNDDMANAQHPPSASSSRRPNASNITFHQ